MSSTPQVYQSTFLAGTDARAQGSVLTHGSLLLNTWRPSKLVQYCLDKAVSRTVFFLLLLLNILGNLGWALDRGRSLQDLGSFLHSGASYKLGVNPYAYHFWIFPQPISADALNLNPPISIYFFELMTLVSSNLVKYSLFATTVVLFLITVLALVRVYPNKRDPVILLLTFGLAGLWHLLGYLQIYAPLIVAVVAAWLSMRRGNLLIAGLLIGFVAAVKPNFIIWPALLLAGGHWRISLYAIATAAIISVIPLAIDGPEVYREWLDLSLSFGGLQWASNASLASMGYRFGLPVAGQIMGSALVVAVAAWLWRQRPGLLDATSLALVTVLLFGPISWAGYTLFLLPVLFSRPWDSPIWAAVLMLNAPFWLVREATIFDPVSNVLVGGLYTWALILILGSLMAQGCKEASSVRSEAEVLPITPEALTQSHQAAVPVPEPVL